MLCMVLTGRTIEENLQQVATNRPYLSLVELRLDLLAEGEADKAVEFPTLIDLPVILTCRRHSDGGAYRGAEKERLALLQRVSQGKFAYIDLEDDLKRGAFEEQLRQRKVEIIRSYHDFEKIPADFFHRAAKIAARGEIPKLAVTPTSISDLITLFRSQQELADIQQKIIVGMGEYGVPARILYKRLGSMLSYCSNDAIAPGQLTAQIMSELYRSEQVDQQTKIFGVIGNPISQTNSPHIHNPALQAIKFNAIYVPFLVDSVRSFFALAELLPISGFSVTVPFKQAILPYLGKITREVKHIGSCNTVVRSKNLWSGTNTDYYGFVEPLLDAIEAKTLQSALVVGAGGAARAVVWALRNYGCKVTILNRTLEKAKQLASETMSAYDTLENAHLYHGVDLVVQTTTVGMAGDVAGDPIPSFIFSGREIFYELIYKPRETELLRRAVEAEASIVYGIEMLLRQAKLQFEAFSGYHYPKWVQPYQEH